MENKPSRSLRRVRCAATGFLLLMLFVGCARREQGVSVGAPTHVTVNDLFACESGHTALDPERHVGQMSIGEDGFVQILWHDGGDEPGWEKYYVYVKSHERVYHQPQDLATTHILRVTEGVRVECRGAMFISRSDIVPEAAERIPIIGTLWN